MGLSQPRQWWHRQWWRRLMTAATMASLPPPPMTTTTTLALIALALALPWTRIGRQGGGCAMMRHICRCHGCCPWCHLCLHSRDDSAKDNGRGNRQGRHANTRGLEEVGHHDPIGVEQQKQKQKQKQKQNQNQQQWQQHHCLCACRQLRPCCCHCCLCLLRGSSGSSTGVAVVAAGLLIEYNTLRVR